MPAPAPMLRCPACASYRCDLCPGPADCACLHNRRAIMATARQRFETSNDTGLLRHSLGQLLALEWQRQARLERKRRRGPVAGWCQRCGARTIGQTSRKTWCSPRCRQAAYRTRKAERLAAGGDPGRESCEVAPAGPPGPRAMQFGWRPDRGWAGPDADFAGYLRA